MERKKGNKTTPKRTETENEQEHTDDLPGVVLATEYSHEVGDRDAPLPPDVKVLERPSNVVFPDKHVPVDGRREEFLILQSHVKMRGGEKGGERGRTGQRAGGRRERGGERERDRQTEKGGRDSDTSAGTTGGSD